MLDFTTPELKELPKHGTPAAVQENKALNDGVSEQVLNTEDPTISVSHEEIAQSFEDDNEDDNCLFSSKKRKVIPRVILSDEEQSGE